MGIAVARRCEQELGFSTPLNYVYKFQYSAQFGDLGSECELCSVYVGRYDGKINANTNEVAAWRWIPSAEIETELRQAAANYTPWFKLEWQRLREDFAAQIPTP